MSKKFALHQTKIWLTVGTCILTLGSLFTNCSPVSFSVDAASIAGKLDTTGGIVINGDAPFTNSTQVNLSLSNGSAEEMYITNDPTCETGGEWQPYSREKAWTLDRKNDVAKVYVKYREKSFTEVQSSCFNDDILHDDIAPTVSIRTTVATFINTDSQTVDLVASDSGSGIDVSTCDQDGGSSALCTDKHAMSGLAEGQHNLVVRARDKAGNVSDPSLVAFTVDLTAPTIIFTQTPAAISGTAESVFGFSGSDALSGVKGYECRVDGGVAQACSSPFTRSLPEGQHTFAVLAIDVAGNRSPEISFTWKVDLSAPSLRFTQTPAAITNSPTANFGFDGTDDGQPITKFECAADSAGYASCSSPRALNSLTHGTHKFNVRGYDSAGNVSQPISYSWLVDLVKPVVTITAQPGPVTSATSVNFAFNATDADSGIAKTECQIDDGAFAVCDQTKSYTSLNEGIHKFAVRATDRAGNVSDAISYSFRIDTTKPVLEILSGPAKLTNLTNADFTMRATDANGGEIARIECKLENESTFTACASPKLYSAVTEGPHVFSARAVDKAGNVSDVKTYEWTVDVTGPAINFGKIPLSVIGQLDPAEIQFTVTDTPAGVGSVSCGLDGAMAGCVLTGESRTFQRLNVGKHSFVVTAKDKLGNESTKTIDFEVRITLIDKLQTYQVNTTKKLDVLVVIDNSGSMATEQQNMGDRFSTFLDQLNGLDWQVGIVTTDLGTNAVWKDGRLVTMNGTTNAQYILTSKMDPAEARRVFASTIRRTESGSGDEQGIGATYRAIERAFDTSKPENASNAALFRQDAALATVVVTDANETNSAGIQERNKPESLLNLIKAKWNNKKSFAFHSIIVRSGDEVCRKKDGNESFGVAYETISNLTGGAIGTVCAVDYGSQLKQMGQISATLTNSINLDCAPVDTNGDGKLDVSVSLSSGQAPPAFTVDATKISFSSALPAGGVELRYNCLAP